MNTIKVSELEIGHEFDHPVFLEDNILFLPAGIPLKEKDIKRLSKWGVKEVYTEGYVKVFDGINANSEQMWGVPTDTALFKFYSAQVDKVNTLLDKIRNFEAITAQELGEITNEIIDNIKEKHFESVRLILCNNAKIKEFAKSCVNCAILSSNIGHSMGLNDAQLKIIVEGALLHDVGMLRIPAEITDKRGNLENKERNTVKSHPLYSYQIIKSELHMDEHVAEIAMQHHERWDGEGYPQGLKGEDIDIEARIVAVSDAFEAMISERPYRNSMVGYEAMKQILSDNGRRFDPEILKVFIRSMGIYPLGSLVQLSDSSICRVISINQGAPLRPELIGLISAEGTEYPGDTGPVINLLEKTNLFIARAIDIKDLINRM